MGNLSNTSPGSRPSPGPKPNLKDGKVIKISIYGNNLVVYGFLFRTHHVFAAIETDHEHILLEVERCTNGKIHINKETYETNEQLVATRKNHPHTGCWRSERLLSETGTASIQTIINEYHDDICQKCKLQIRCTTGWSRW